MKIASIISRLVLSVGFALSFASCSLFDKTDDVTFDVALTHTFQINVTSEDTEVIILQTPAVLDAAAVSADFAKYKDRIKGVAVTGVTYQIQNCTISGVLLSDGIVAYSSITVTEPNPDPNIGTSAIVGVENLKAAENQDRTLQFGQVALNDMSGLLKTNKELNLYLTGTLSKSPAKFDLVVTIKASVTADKL